ncbi:restriction endonuclease subunit S [uncultured Thiodictyon sp.]|uniref:restriction endonuclease subunit S n=1 Tax=uncultured Thiodictyon sp. TaxID=1846217 RepID=UPI0025EFC1AE|nr:restriction endonuclease subunit S [uncultured Thiodictyon sp.]
MERYESYKPSGAEWIGDIPSHWEIRPGFTCFKENKDRNKGLVEKTVLSLSYGRIVIKPEEKLTGLVPESFEGYQLIIPGDIIVRTIDLQNDFTSLRVGYARDRGMITSAYLALRCSPEVNSEYVCRLLECYDALKVFYGMGSGLRQNMDFWDFKRLPITVPPRHEQDRIVAFLDQKTAEIDAAIDKKERLIELFLEQRISLIRHSILRGLAPNAPVRDSGIDWIGAIPNHYHISRLGFVARIGNGSTPNRSVPGYWNGGDIPWLNSSKVNDFEITEADQFITKRAARECHLPLVASGSLLVAITGEGKTRGMAALTRIDTMINQHLAYVTVTDNRLHPEFLLYYLTSIYQVLRDESSSQGSTKGAITCGELAKIPIIFPPIDEQLHILAQLKLLLDQTEKSLSITRRQIAFLLEFKSVVIAEVVVGKLRV